MAVTTGTEAPDFTLFSNKMEPFTLSDHRDKSNVLMLFFPGAFTSVCTTELNTVNGELDAFGGDDTQIVGLSTDSPFALEEFRSVHKFEFPLLSDHEGEVIGFCELEVHWPTRPWVAFVGVRQALRDRGIGTALVSWALGQEFDAGAQAGLLTLSPANRTALRAYEKVGFRRFRLIDVLERRV